MKGVRRRARATDLCLSRRFDVPERSVAVHGDSTVTIHIDDPIVVILGVALVAR
jgi:hypothetical protein